MDILVKVCLFKPLDLALGGPHLSSFTSMIILYEGLKISVIQSDIRTLLRIDYGALICRHFQPALVWNQCHFDNYRHILVLRAPMALKNMS